MTKEKSKSEAKLHVQNVGGITSVDVEFVPGVNILVGRNATNRTSLLYALRAALGSREVPINAGADTATAKLVVDNDEYVQEFSGPSGSASAGGDPYSEDSTVIELFASLLQSNRARQAVIQGDNLREIVMRPIDTEGIEQQIEKLLDERSALDDELDEIDDLRSELPELEQRRNSVEQQIEDKQEQLQERKQELEEAELSVEETREEQSKLDSKLDSLTEIRSELDDVRFNIDTKEEAIQQLREERADLRSELEDLPSSSDSQIAELESEISRLQAQKETPETEINELQNVVGFNEEMLLDDGAATLAKQGPVAGSDDITAQLNEGNDTICWTCGSEVNRSEIEDTVDNLRELSKTKVGELNEMQSELATVRQEYNELTQSAQRRDSLEGRIAEVETEVTELKEEVEKLKENRTELSERVETVEAEIDELEADVHEEILELHKQVNETERELGRLEKERDDLLQRIESIEETIRNEEQIQDQRAEVSEEITNLRTRIADIESNTIDAFNEHMATLLDELEYDNLERIWIQKAEKTEKQGRRNVSKSVFNLNVVRATDAGTVYEDKIEHLSESEQEIVGIVFALAGYLAHEVHESVPFMLLDSVEAIDSGRIAKLVQHLKQFPDYLAIALLPEDEQALPEEYNRIRQF